MDRFFIFDRIFYGSFAEKVGPSRFSFTCTDSIVLFENRCPHSMLLTSKNLIGFSMYLSESGTGKRALASVGSAACRARSRATPDLLNVAGSRAVRSKSDVAYTRVQKTLLYTKTSKTATMCFLMSCIVFSTSRCVTLGALFVPLTTARKTVGGTPGSRVGRQG